MENNEVDTTQKGVFDFENYETAARYFAESFLNRDCLISMNQNNVETYKSSIVELRNILYSIPAGKVLSMNNYHRQYPFWAVAESVSEILGLKRSIMERYSPEKMDWAYHIHSTRMPDYSYGERWHVDNQLVNIFNKLDKNPTTKRAVMNIYNGTDTYDSKLDVPCTLSHIFSIRNNKLDLTTLLRSQDFFAGSLYDTFLSNFILQSFTSWLNNSNQFSLKSGNLYFYVDSLHYYPERNKDRLNELVNSECTNFYSDVESYTLDVDIQQYFKDLYHLSDCEMASYNGNFSYSDEKLNKINSPVFRDFARVFLLKNSKHYKMGNLFKSYSSSFEVSEIKKWVLLGEE